MKQSLEEALIPRNGAPKPPLLVMPFLVPALPELILSLPQWDSHIPPRHPHPCSPMPWEEQEMGPHRAPKGLR